MGLDHSVSKVLAGCWMLALAMLAFGCHGFVMPPHAAPNGGSLHRESGNGTRLCAKPTAATVGWTPLHEAVINGKTNAAAALLQEGFDVNAAYGSTNTLTPLLVAYDCCGRGFAEWLIERGAKLDIFSACAKGDIGTIRAILKDNPDAVHSRCASRSPLWWAIVYGGREATKVLLNHGADVNAEVADGVWPPTLAAGRGQPGVLALLLESGADVEARGPAGNTLLHYSANAGDLDAVKLLLRKGLSAQTLNDHGTSPLVSAVAGGSHSVVRFLLPLCEDREQRSRALWGAVSGYHSEIVTEILEAGNVNVNWRYRKGAYTALQIACATLEPDIETIVRLLEAGADVNAETKMGRTPLDILESYGRRAEITAVVPVIDLLRRHGARNGSSSRRRKAIDSRKAPQQERGP